MTSIDDNDDNEQRVELTKGEVEKGEVTCWGFLCQTLATDG